MEYEIWGNTMPAVTLRMRRGDSIYTQSGGMSWMTEGIEMETNVKGGFMRGLGRMFSGESFFMATYTCRAAGADITLSSTLPGEIKVFRITPGNDIIAQKGAFLCAEQSVEISATIPMRASGGFFGGEGFVLQRYTGNGLVFCEMDGCIKQYDLAPGEVMKVNTGNVAAFEASVNYSVEIVRGFKNMLFGGEGLFLTTLRGPGRIWLQTMTVSQLANRIIPYMPVNHD